MLLSEVQIMHVTYINENSSSLSLFFAKSLYYNVKDPIPCCVVHIKLQLWTQSIAIVRWDGIVC